MSGLRWSAWVLALGFLVGATGCTKSRSDQGCKADTDCKNGTLCEGGMCIPDEVAQKARNFDKQQADKAKAASKKEALKEEESEAPAKADAALEVGIVPLIPQEKSDPPKLEEWEKAPEVNTQHEHGIAKECSMKVVREWVRVFCRGEILGYQDLTEFGKKSVDHFVSVKESSLSFVGRIKPGPRQFLRVCRASDRAALAIYWPPGKDRPEHIALGDGRPCEKLEYEDSPPKKEAEELAEGRATLGKPKSRPTEGHLTPKGVARD